MILRASIAIAAVLIAMLAFLSALEAQERAVASFYGGHHHGRKTASGERFNMHGMTAAHRSLPFGTRLRVCNGPRCVVVRVNDRGPFIRGRSLDLSRGAAEAIGMVSRGVAPVSMSVVR